MLFETIKYLDIKPDGVYLDLTFGFGGHSKKILEYLNMDGRLLVCDKDINAYKIAKKTTETDSRINAFHISFDNIYFILNKLKLLRKINGIVIDLGISSYQIDKTGLGFINNNFLDMRLNAKNIFRIIDWINFANKNDLENIFNLFNESFLTKIITEKIILLRHKKNIKTTNDLCNFFLYLFGKNKGKKILSKLFQFMRLLTNNDCFLLEKFLWRIYNLTRIEDNIILISFNSLEEYIIKNLLYKIKTMTIVFIQPSFKEINNNFSSRSSRMKIINKTIF